jgi:hypothetical protein
MKGIVFTEFLEMVETKFSPKVADEIITAAQLPSGGAYTAVGTYDHQEIAALVLALNRITGQPVPDLIRTFGRHLFGRFVKLYPQFFLGVSSAFEFLANVDHYIHVEVLKIYPDAQLPRFEIHREGAERMVLVYRSERALHDLAEGLIEGCAEHFQERIALQKEDLSDGKGTCVRFTLAKRPNHE